MRIRTFVAFLALTLASSAAAAAADDMRVGADAPCWNSGTTVDIVTCFAASRAQSDADLNRTYAQIVSVLDADDRQRLRKAERAWLVYRDAACEAEYRLWNGGTGGPPAQLACIDGETRRHLAYLRRTYRLRLQRLGR